MRVSDVCELRKGEGMELPRYVSSALRVIQINTTTFIFVELLL